MAIGENKSIRTDNKTGSAPDGLSETSFGVVFLAHVDSHDGGTDRIGRSHDRLRIRVQQLSVGSRFVLSNRIDGGGVMAPNGRQKSGAGVGIKFCSFHIFMEC